MTTPGMFPSEHGPDTAPEGIAEIERTLGAALRDFASELRLADAADFAAFIHIGHMPNLHAIVQSSAELYFKPGTIELAEPGELELVRVPILVGYLDVVDQGQHKTQEHAVDEGDQ